MKLFNNIQTYGWAVLPQTRPSSFHGVEEYICMDVLQPCKTIKLMAGPRSPTYPVTAQLISRRWKFIWFWCYADIQQRSNQRLVMRPQNGAAHFTVLKTFFNWMVWSFSKTVELMAGPWFPKHGPVPFTGLKNFFVPMFCKQLKTCKFMAGPRSPTSPVTAQLISRRSKIVSFWCFADFPQRSNERMVVIPQTRSSSFHGIEDFSQLDGLKLFKNIRTYGWAVFPQTRPSSVHGVDELFCLDVLQLC